MAKTARWLSLLLLTGVHAQSTSPSNDTSWLQSNVGFLMSTTLHNMASSIKLVPLTNNAGLSGSTDQLQVCQSLARRLRPGADRLPGHQPNRRPLPDHSSHCKPTAAGRYRVHELRPQRFLGPYRRSSNPQSGSQQQAFRYCTVQQILVCVWLYAIQSVSVRLHVHYGRCEQFVGRAHWFKRCQPTQP